MCSHPSLPIYGNIRVVKRWVPKEILKAQGYYQGNTQLWLPKTKLTIKGPEWCPNRAVGGPQLKETPNSERHQKLNMDMDKVRDNATVALLTTTQMLQANGLQLTKGNPSCELQKTEPAPTLVRILKELYVPKDPPLVLLSIKERAFALQTLLFGLTSFTLSLLHEQVKLEKFI